MMNPWNKITPSNAKGNRSDNELIATSPAHMSGKSEARIIGSAVAGISELALFHPVDTGEFYLQCSISSTHIV
jgi:hypothetical protein